MKNLQVLSICSGAEAASLAWEPLGMEFVGYSEIDPFCRALLQHRFPETPLHGDFTGLISDPPACDILVGGPPCQAFSLGGKRNSLADDRGALTLAFVELADAIDRRNREEGRPPVVIVYENVPGIFNTSDNAFGCLLAGLVGEDVPLVPAGDKWPHAGAVLGPKRRLAWRVLDAQYFGVPQRRKRCVLVASAGDGFDPAEILFESHASSQGVREDHAGGESSAARTQRSPSGSDQVAFVKAGRAQNNKRQETWVLGNVAPTLNLFDSGASRCTTMVVQKDKSIRRLTMVEEERLQGFPDNWTAIPWRGKPVADCPESLRHYAISNSMAVPMMAWLGKRIQTKLGDT